jgi:hypothetical protein
VSVVRLGAAELVVGASVSQRSARKVLQLAAPTEVAHDDVQVPVRSEVDHAAVVVAPSRLPLVTLVGGLGATV